VYSQEPTQFDILPAVTIDLPVITRVPEDTEEDQLGSFTWIEEWPIRLYTSAYDVGAAETECLQIIAQLIGAFDAGESLTATSLCRLTDAQPVQGKVNTGAPDGQVTIGYVATLMVRHLT
jgi:hypothetical protein